MFCSSNNEPIVMKFHVRENLSGALVGQLVPTRNTTLDSSQWKGVKFMIVSEPEVTEQFAISQDGTIYTQKGLDREHKDSYQLSVIAESGRGVIAHRGFYQVLTRVHLPLLWYQYNSYPICKNHPSSDDNVL